MTRGRPKADEVAELLQEEDRALAALILAMGGPLVPSTDTRNLQLAAAAWDLLDEPGRELTREIAAACEPVSLAVREIAVSGVAQAVARARRDAAPG